MKRAQHGYEKYVAILAPSRESENNTSSDCPKAFQALNETCAGLNHSRRKANRPRCASKTCILTTARYSCYNPRLRRRRIGARTVAKMLNQGEPKHELDIVTAHLYSREERQLIHDSLLL